VAAKNALLPLFLGFPMQGQDHKTFKIKLINTIRDVSKEALFVTLRTCAIKHVLIFFCFIKT
jgi:hypothetical protein